jgi:hypothetical protein
VRHNVADLISLAGNTTQRRKDTKAFQNTHKAGAIFSPIFRIKGTTLKAFICRSPITDNRIPAFALPLANSP